jgi:hypothetical protein
MVDRSSVATPASLPPRLAPVTLRTQAALPAAWFRIDASDVAPSRASFWAAVAEYNPLGTFGAAGTATRAVLTDARAGLLRRNSQRTRWRAFGVYAWTKVQDPEW